MKYLLKPWIVALLFAICLHGLLLVWLKDKTWPTSPSQLEVARLQVSLLPSTEPSPEPAKPTPNEATPNKTVVEEAPPKVTEKEDSIPTPLSAPSTTKISDETQELDADNAPYANSTAAQSEQVVTGTTAPKNTFSLDEITDPKPEQDDTKQSWQQSKLLDIGDSVSAVTPKVNPAKDAFSPAFRQALKEAKQLQKEYLKGAIKKTKYPITEDADGTKYVNIKGICWKIPDPGTEEAWQIVLAGCSGQTDVFHFELNITTDILTSDQLQLLPFGGE